MVRLGAIAGLIALAASVQALQPPLHIQRLLEKAKTHDSARVEDVSATAADYKEYFLQTPVDHFHNDTKYEPHSNATFGLRYWFDAQYYKPGGPVIVLAAGETSGVGRLPFLEKGIVYELAKATGGLGVILEHRYYGTSYPTEDFSTENLRFLTTEQSLADTAFFAKNVKFEGVDVDLNPKTTPWIAYGGSYAGSYVAFLRIVYPDIYYGAISSSGVPVAIWDYWQYFEAARIYAPGDCSITTQKLQNAVDNILIKKNDTEYPAKLKEAFGYSGTADDLNFASVLSTGIYGLQSYNWDPTESSNSFFDYCEHISSDKVIHNNTEAKRETAKELLVAGGYADEADVLTNRLLNWIGWLYRTIGFRCVEGDDESCFGTADAKTLAAADHSQTWRLWQYQVCTEWGYLQTGSGTPEDQLSMISRLIDLESQAAICKSAFNITEPAKVENINKFGAFDISYPRVAWLDGEWDPWRAAGVHAIGQPERESTTSEPFILIDKAVHHWDENGVVESEQTPDFPPKPVAEAKRQIREFVKAWVEEFADTLEEDDIAEL
ncbi:peptidase S28 [Microdochium bolleyi]|uniref:Peptidase S28 n=1 Tax=Microdochium bolleyi TaxID=196109 RepID=A0A136J685_9PEZI|nr:peptidase S28 [Microdochium bolleyi]